MTAKADFNAEEWALVAQAPALAGMRVIAADRGGTLRESVSMARAYAEARQGKADGLMGELLASPPLVDPRSAQQLSQTGTEKLREALAILRGKATPDEVSAYQSFVLDVAETVAKAHKEGGFLGIGGKAVSDRERAALEEIAGALGVTYGS